MTTVKPCSYRNFKAPHPSNVHMIASRIWVRLYPWETWPLRCSKVMDRELRARGQCLKEEGETWERALTGHRPFSSSKNPPWPRDGQKPEITVHWSQVWRSKTKPQAYPSSGKGVVFSPVPTALMWQQRCWGTGLLPLTTTQEQRAHTFSPPLLTTTIGVMVEWEGETGGGWRDTFR